MEWELIKQSAELGAVFVLALIIFIMSLKLSEKREKRMEQLLKADQETRSQHTKVLTELIVYLKNKNGSR